RLSPPQPPRRGGGGADRTRGPAPGLHRRGGGPRGLFLWGPPFSQKFATPVWRGRGGAGRPPPNPPPAPPPPRPRARAAPGGREAGGRATITRKEAAMRSDERGPDEQDEEDEGEEVLSLAWDGGGPWAAAGTACVRKCGAEYRAVYPGPGEATGPYGSLAEAV